MPCEVSTYHPASNGLVEWCVQTFQTSLKESGEVDVQQQTTQTAPFENDRSTLVSTSVLGAI